MRPQGGEIALKAAASTHSHSNIKQKYEQQVFK